MKVKRLVSDKMLAANRANAAKATGPRNTTSTRKNAVTHGLLAKHLMFKDENEQAEFGALVSELMIDYEPLPGTELALVHEIAICFWKLSTLNSYEQLELANRRKASTALLQTVADHCEQEPLPLFQRDDGMHSEARLGWECRELIVKCGSRNSETERDKGELTDKAGQVQIEAKLSTSLESLLRYGASVKRDLYRAIGTLRDIQRERQGTS